jgi:hypothetical protein
MYSDIKNDVAIIDLSNLKKNDKENIDQEVEWVAEGLKISDKSKGILPYYQENKINQVIRINDNNILVTDKMGTLRIFPYPCPDPLKNQIFTLSN